MSVSTETENRTVELRISNVAASVLKNKAQSAGQSLEEYLQALAEKDASLERDGNPLDVAVGRLTSRTPEQVRADRERVMTSARPARELPEGKTLFDVVEGSWPGDESDEQIHEASEKLS